MRLLAFTVLCLSLFSYVMTAADSGPDRPEPIGLPREVDQAPVDLTGYYDVTSADSDGDEHMAALLIYRPLDRDTKQRFNIYVVQWFQNGKVTVGVAPMERHRLVVGFGFKTGENKAPNGIGSGMATYAIIPDEKTGRYKLVGKWLTLPGDGKMGTETLTWLKEYK